MTTMLSNILLNARKLFLCGCTNTQVNMLISYFKAISTFPMGKFCYIFLGFPTQRKQIHSVKGTTSQKISFEKTFPTKSVQIEYRKSSCSDIYIL